MNVGMAIRTSAATSRLGRARSRREFRNRAKSLMAWVLGSLGRWVVGHWWLFPATQRPNDPLSVHQIVKHRLQIIVRRLEAGDGELVFEDDIRELGVEALRLARL